MYNIRAASIEDVPAITEIYNEAVLNTVATFDTEPKTAEQQMTWFRQHGPKNPILVAERNGRVVGWASLNAYSDRKAYENTVEISLYVTEEERGRGAGKTLMAHIVEAGQKAGVHTILSRIVEGNDSSIHLHELHGFVPVGIMREVGFKFGRLLDVHLLQKIYK